MESQPDWGPSSLPSRIYAVVPGTKLTPMEALVLLALAASLFAALGAGRAPATPRPFGGALVLLTLGLVMGAVTGRDAGAGTTTIVDAGRTALPVILMPLIAVQVSTARSRCAVPSAWPERWRRSKASPGWRRWRPGRPRPRSQGVPLTYYEAPANIIMMAFLAYVLAAAMTRVSLPRWVWAATPFVLAALLLSYRRSFWVAAVLALLVVAVVALGGQGRRLVLPLVAITVIGGYLALADGRQPALGGEPRQATGVSVASRLQSLNPSSITASKDDRYRLDERRNVLADLRDSPIAGVGLGVDYRQRYGLSIGDITRQYVHFAALWWWMKLGLLGLLGYLWLLGAAVFAGSRLARAPRCAVRAAGLAGAATVVGYAVAETTGTFAGADLRSSVVVGAAHRACSLPPTARWSQRRRPTPPDAAASARASCVAAAVASQVKRAAWAMPSAVRAGRRRARLRDRRQPGGGVRRRRASRRAGDVVERAGVGAMTTGVPEAIASSGTMPKPS